MKICEFSQATANDRGILERIPGEVRTAVLSARSTSARAFLTGSLGRLLLSNRAEPELVGRPVKSEPRVSINERQWAGVNPGTIGPRSGD